MHFTFHPDSPYFTGNKFADVCMVNEKTGARVGRIIQHDKNEFGGHFDNIECWWPVKEKTMELAQKAMLDWANHPKVQAKIAVQ